MIGKFSGNIFAGIHRTIYYTNSEHEPKTHKELPVDISKGNSAEYKRYLEELFTEPLKKFLNKKKCWVH